MQIIATKDSDGVNFRKSPFFLNLTMQKQCLADAAFSEYTQKYIKSRISLFNVFKYFMFGLLKKSVWNVFLFYAPFLWQTKHKTSIINLKQVGIFPSGTFEIHPSPPHLDILS